MARASAVLAALASLALASCGAENQGPTWVPDGGDTGATDTGVDTTPADGWPDTTPTDATPDTFTEIPDVPWDEVCGTEDLPLEYDVRSDVLIVLDRSGSMAMMLTHLKTAVNTIVSSSEAQIWFGLMPFPSSVDPNVCSLYAPLSQCNAPDHPHVMLGPLMASEISGVLGAPGMGICGSTPTTVTLENALTYLLSTSTGHDQYVLLATDGLPNCNAALDGATCDCQDTEVGCADNPEACTDDDATYDALDALYAAGIPTFVLAMGGAFSGSDVTILNNMAAHGGTGSYYPAETPASILTMFESIMSSVVVSCSFDLNPTDEVDPDLVNIYVGGILVGRDEDHLSGWDYVDADTIQFYGPWCDAIMSGDAETVSAAYGCPTYII